MIESKMEHTKSFVMMVQSARLTIAIEFQITRQREQSRSMLHKCALLTWVLAEFNRSNAFSLEF